MNRSERLTLWSAALALTLAACGGGSGPNTTEALLPIASSTSIDSATATTSPGAPAAGLSEVQQSTVDRLIAAFETGDAEAVLELWTEHGEHYRPDIEFDLAMGGRWSDLDCDATSDGKPRCDFLYTNRLLESLDAPPLAGYVRLDLSDRGEIDSWDYDTGNRATTAAYLQPFSDWVAATDPEAADNMFDWNGFGFRHREAYALWTVKVDEYLAGLG